ncbi:MAG: YjbE family putative metal transport protein [Parcubacteria group bacterium]
MQSLLVAGGPFFAFLQVVMIDLTLAGDNAVAVGMAAAGLPPKDRRRAIVLGLAAAVVLLICFALIAVQLLSIIGLLLAGGILLLWVCWRMFRDIREQSQEAHGEVALEDATGVAVTEGDPEGAAAVPTKRKTLVQALVQILLADVSMSLDNVLAVAGAAREHPGVLVFGLLLSITLMGLAASWIAKLLHRWRWLGYVGLVIVLYVALHMIWEGHREVVVRMHKTADYNAVMTFAPIGPEEQAEDLR